jgi:2'-5' RNA ligase
LRLFIAINLDGKTKAGICRVIDQLKPYALRGRFIPVDNLHLTLLFIGETNRVGDIKGAMEGLRSPAFKMVVGGLGSFPRSGGDVFWLRVKAERLAQIHRQLRDSLVERGFNLESRAYKPHLTLGRELVFTRDLDIFSLVPQEHLEMAVEKVSLMKSERIDGRMKYTEVYSVSLEEAET